MTDPAVPCREWLLDIIFPSRCAACGLPGPVICAGCRGRLVRLRGPVCRRCGAPTAWPVDRCRECSARRLAFASARAGVAYGEVARPLLRAWKERGLRPLAAVAAGIVADVVPRPETAVITYIPPDGDRSLRRGHHPARALAVELGALWEIDVLPLLIRTRLVGRQTGLSLGERRLNVHGAFAARGSVPAAVVLVDDVYTTGATVGAGAASLRAAGATRVDVVTFARTAR